MKHASLFASVAAFAAASLFFAPIAYGGVTYAITDEGATLIVDVDADGATLDAAQVVAGITKIVKQGVGKLNAVPISSYTGDFDIESGIWCCTAAGHFGATSTTASSGTIWVRDGASIEYAGSATNPGTLSGKTIHLYGAGASDATSGSKLFLSASIQMSGAGLGKNLTFVLHDDATFYSRNRLCMIGTYNLGGKTLTFAGGSGKSHDVCGTFTNGGHVVIASGTTWMSQAAAFVFAAECADEAYVEIESGATFNIKDKVTAANGWTVKNKGGIITCNTQRVPTTLNIGVWAGPIELSGSSQLANYGNNIGGWGISNTVLNVEGPLSGTGTLLVGPGWLNLRHAENSYSGPVTVRGKGLKRTPGNNENVVPPGAGGIGVWNGANVFLNASSITLRDSARLEFMDETASAVGALTFIGDVSTFTAGDPGDDTQSIKGGSATMRPTIAGITKTGSNVLVVDSTVHVTGKAVISNGTLRIPYRSIRGTPGLYETHVMPVSPGSPNWDDGYVGETGWNGSNNKYRIGRPWLENYQQHLIFDEKGICTIGPQRAVMPLANGKSDWADGYTTRNGWWYHGYIWNNTDAPATYTFWHGFNTDAAIYLGEDHEMYDFLTGTASGLSDGVTGRPSAAREITFQPGATPIDVYVYGGKGANWLREVPSVSVRYGFAFAPSSVCSAESLNQTFHTFYDTPSAANTNALISALAQFSHFKDESGVGELFTADVYGDADADKKVAYQPVFDDLEFVYGTTLDLSDNGSFQVKDLTGSPTIVNAVEFRITNNWTICSADFPAADSTVRHPMTVDGALAFADGATFSIDTPLAIARDIVVATATDGITGAPIPSDDCKDWRLKVDGSNLILKKVSATMLIFR